MSNKITNSFVAVLIITNLSMADAQPPTEIYLFELSNENNEIIISNPKNLSNNVGFDNQPTFINNEEIVYSSTFGNQTDIVKLDFTNNKKTRITDSPGSEFSPKLTPDGRYISAIVLGKDGSQILYKYPLRSGEIKIISSDQKIGYYCWYDKKTVFSYIVGTPPSLQEWNTKNDKFKVIMMNPGRSLQKIPGQKKISFIHKESDDIWYLNSYNPDTDKVEYIMEAVKGAEDLTWSQDGTAYLSLEKNIYKFKLSTDDSWKLIANMETFGLSNASRIAVSPNGKWMAVVIDE